MTQKILPGIGEGQTMKDSFNRIGKQLLVARKERGLRLADVARELRISADYLKLLEGGDFDQLPAPTYVSGFLRTYGKFLELDGAELAGRFYAIQGEASSKMDYKLPMTAGPPQRSAPAVASLFVVLALVGYGGWYWFSGRTTSDSNVKRELEVVEIDRTKPGQIERTVPMIKAEGDTAPASNTVTTATLNTKNFASASPDINIPKNIDAVEQIVTPDTANIAPSAVTDDDLVTKLVTDTVNGENIDAVAVASEMVQQLAPGRGAAVATSRDPDQEVTIRATASSWIEIVRDDGTAVLKKLMKTGESYVVDDGSALYLSTGNAGGIELVTADNDVITVGAVGEIVRDLPLANNRLRERF